MIADPVMPWVLITPLTQWNYQRQSYQVLQGLMHRLLHTVVSDLDWS
jgi:hypothetical protein